MSPPAKKRKTSNSSEHRALSSASSEGGSGNSKSPVDTRLPEMSYYQVKEMEAAEVAKEMADAKAKVETEEAAKEEAARKETAEKKWAYVNKQVLSGIY